ncbi:MULTISPECIES: peptidylprolyl isomerase [Paenarthrobacter]|uniref:peptidylprolyl isomerase n=1 Tax=Paenarthrobacter TaxID=1742992 RepID=UPI0019175C1D|nr:MULTISPECIES: peptidylprolyl isomerase [Paenarthrobacter]MCW3766169.1 peptidylprolyl isomerase [Paenarthrobacter sp. PAE-2]QQQ60952.1 peptidylprolyl isomerase [Paenarthrobacter ureafaciens]UOD79685.1 peptidylprolyl isomerase [Paenarthrobacter ureafaciens]WNZ04973.1 peptidylprolyl isomerase [Paenarthrobacter ureafaciens]
MATRSRDDREARRRIRQMEAKRALRQQQTKRRRRDNIVAVGAGASALVLAAVLQLTVFNSNPTEAEYAAAQAGLSSPSASPQASNSADVPAADTAEGKTFTGELALNGGVLGVRIDGTTAPQAAAVIKSLSDSGYYDGTFCHRLTTSETFGLLQCGAKSEDGADDANYRWGPLENTPSNNTYPAGTIAVARTGNNAYGNGHQFFIVYKDTTIPADSAGGYTVVGQVTSGLDVVSKIAAAGLKADATNNDGAPVAPVTIDSFSLK